jgi:membrane associated rhomboid family serine protease
MLPLYDDNPTQSPPIVVYGLLVLNVAVFLFQLGLVVDSGELAAKFFNTWAVVPRQLFRAPAQGYFTLISYQFLHGGLGHILGNMWYLWIFGNNIEDHLGKFKFLLFYLACGIFAAVVQSVFSFNASVPLIGASGSVSGVMGAYITKYPRTRVLTFIPPLFVLWLPAAFLLGFWIFGQTVYALTALNSNVAFIAHVAGFGAGMVLFRVFNEEV